MGDIGDKKGIGNSKDAKARFNNEGSKQETSQNQHNTE